MPKVVSKNLPWLSRPAPGYALFDAAQSSTTNASAQRSAGLLSSADDPEYFGPKRLLARRGTEVFNVVGKQLRWADLATLKSNWEDQGQSFGNSARQSIRQSPDDDNSHRVLTLSIHEEIRQIATSPSGHFLAIATSHLVYVAILPDQSHLRESDRRPLKLKTWQIGRTAHCRGEGRSPVVSTLWHPLALANAQQDCLVTVTTDAVVRLWELSRNSLFTMDNPTIAVDLKKLADGQSCDDDYGPSSFGKVQAFSPDSFDMEVASAAFGGQGYDDEQGWAPMTLWVAMRNGDVYALCPLLPTRWTPSSTLVPSLSTSVVSKLALIQGDEVELNVEEAKAVRQQYQWVREIDEEEPGEGTPESENEPAVVIRKRPVNPSPIPRLQGPFIPSLSDDELELLDVTDIHIIPAKISLPESDEFDEDYEDSLPQDGSSATTVCLSTIDGRVLICLNLDGVEGQWLPKTKKATIPVPKTEAAELLVLDYVAAPTSNKGSDKASDWPVFTEDVVSAYSFFLTTGSTVQFYSLASWLPRLESELMGSSSTAEDDGGLALRLKILCESDITLQEEVLRIDSAPSGQLSAAQVFESFEIGHFLLTSTASEPYSVLFDDPSTEGAEAGFPSHLSTASEEIVTPTVQPVRAPYVPSAAFYDQSSFLLRNMTQQVPSRHRAMLKAEIRMSPATLDIMTNAHRSLSGQTAAIERGAAELFRRVERLRSEIHDAVEQMVNLAGRVQDLQEATQENEKGTLDERLSDVNTRQQELNSRYEALKRKVARAANPGNLGKELNAKEAVWAEEIQRMSKNVGIQAEDNESAAASLKSRYEKVKSLSSSLLSEVNSLTQKSQQQLQPPPSEPPSRPTSSSSSRQLQLHQAPEATLPQTKPNDTPAEKSREESELRLSSPRRSASPALPSSNFRIGTPSVSVGSKMQRKKIEEAMRLVEREGAVIEGTMRRLERLGLSTD